MTSFLFVVERTIDLYVKHFKKFYPYFIALFPLIAIQTYAVTYITDSQASYLAETGEFSWAWIIVALLITIFASVATLLVQIALINLVAQLHTGQEPTPYKKMFSGASKRLLPVILGSILLVLATIGGFILFVIPAIMIGIWYMFVPVILALHKDSISESFKKSKELVRGRFFTVLLRTIGYGILLAIIVGMITGAVTAPFQFAYSLLTNGRELSATMEKIFILLVYIPASIISVMLAPLEQFVKTIFFLELSAHPVKKEAAPATE